MLALRQPDADAAVSLAETVMLTASQASSLRTVLLHGSLLSNTLTHAMVDIANASMIAHEPLAKVRALGCSALSPPLPRAGCSSAACPSMAPIAFQVPAARLMRVVLHRPWLNLRPQGGSMPTCMACTTDTQ